MAIGCAGASQASAQVSCPRQPVGLNPGDPAHGFTMLLRVNQMENVEAYTNSDEATGGMARRIRAQDIFVINTRFAGSSPAETALLVPALRASFPCNRIIALNGLGASPYAQNYVYALAGLGVHSILLDWEPDDWNVARYYIGGLPRWSYRYRPNLKRIARWTGNLGGTLSAIPEAQGTRVGLIPVDHPDWDYGRIARALENRNRRLGGRHVSTQIVQTQESCMFGRAPFARRVRGLFRQYRTKAVRRVRRVKGKRRVVTVRVKLRKRVRPDPANLGFQVSFSETPQPGDPLPVRNVSVETAANCVASGLHRGARSFFFFASHQSMRLLLAQPLLQLLRPPV